MVRSGRLLPITIALLAGLLALKSTTLASVALARPDISPPGTSPHVINGERDRSPTLASESGTSAVLAASTAVVTHGQKAADWDLLEVVRREKIALDQQARILAARELALDASAAIVDAKLKRLDTTEQPHRILDLSQAAGSDQCWVRLVRVYEAMRPEDAATIFNTLELRTTVEILRRMKERKAAPILAAMAPERARIATQTLASSPGWTSDKSVETSNGSKS